MNLDYLNTLITNLDAERFSELPSKESAEYLQVTMAAVCAISHLTTFTVETTPFPFDELGLKYVEQYLQNTVRRHVVKWDLSNPSHPEVARVQTDSGLKTSKFEAIRAYEHRFFIAGLVFGQILAQQLDLHWVESGDTLGLAKHGESTASVWPWAKVRKFCAFGADDSLQPMMASIVKTEQHGKIIQNIVDDLRLKGLVVPDDRYDQMWVDKNGDITELVIRDAKQTVLHRAVLIRN